MLKPRVYLSLIVILLVVLGNLQLLKAQSPSLIYQKSYGGTDAEGISCMATCSDGGWIFVGETFSINGDVVVNHGSSDCWIVKLDSSNNIQWKRSFGGSNVDKPVCIKQTKDGGYIIGGSTLSGNGDVIGNHDDGRYDYWIIKLNANGVIEWQKCLGGIYDDEATSIDQTTDGGYIVGGSSNSTSIDGITNYGLYDFWIVKLTSTGTVQWQQSYGGTGNDFLKSIIQTADGEYIVTGTTYSPWGSGPNNVHVSHGGADIWVIKLDFYGNGLWQTTLGGSFDDLAGDIHKNFNGEYIVSGYTYSSGQDVAFNHGGADYWLVLLNSTGHLQWEKTYGGSANDEARSAIQTSDGGYIISGSSASIDGDVSNHHTGPVSRSDYWVVKVNSSGDLQWEKSLGGTETDDAYSIIQMRDGSFIIGGECYSNNGDISNPHVSSDFWIAKLANDRPVGSVPMSGIYTIGGNNPNFSDFNSAITALKFNGVKGSVEFRVRAGIYTEQITIPFISGASNENTIKFTAESGQASSVILRYSANSSLDNWVVNLSGSAHIIIDKITLSSLNATFSKVINIDHQSHHDEISSCSINAPVSNSSSLDQCLIFTEDFSGNNFLKFRNNILTNGSYGIYDKCSGYYYTFNQQISDNVFINQFVGGIYWFRVLNSNIKNNSFTTTSLNSEYESIAGEIIFNDTIEKNKINIGLGYGIHCKNGNFIIKNNFVHIYGTSLSYGIWGQDVNGGYSEIYNNSVNCTNTNSSSACLFIPGDYGGEWLIYNNNLINSGGGLAVNIQQTEMISELDRNNYFSSGTVLGKWGAIDCNTINDWKANSAKDVHSRSILPVFVSASDLHVVSTPVPLNFGKPFPLEVPDDIDGESRNIIVPVVGAHEFDDGLPCNVPSAPGAIVNQGGSSRVCPGDTRNYTTSVSTGATFLWSVPTGAEINFGQGSRSINVTYTNEFHESGIISVVKINGCGSSNQRTYTVLRNTPIIPSAISGEAYNLCGKQDVNYSVLPVQGMTYNWTIPSSGINTGDQGLNSILVSFQAVNFQNTIAVTASNSCGSSPVRTLVLRSTPVTPGIISGPAAVSANSTHTYSVPLMSMINSYKWIGPAGSHISALGFTSTNNVLVTTSNTVSIQFGAINPDATIKVQASNDCGNGGVRVLHLSQSSAKISNEGDDASVTIYPNPAKDWLYININADQNTIKEIEITDVSGKRIMNIEVNLISELTDHGVNISGMSPGIYFISLKGDNYSEILKFIKE